MQRPPVYNDHILLVPRVLLIYRFHCIIFRAMGHLEAMYTFSMLFRFQENLRAEVEDYKPNTWLGMEHANILLVGQVGAGKSSFFNTVTSIFRGHVTLQAATGAADHSVTTQVSKARQSTPNTQLKHYLN